MFPFLLSTLYQCSTKTRDGLGNPSPTPKISRDPRDFPRAKPEGNLEGRGKSREISRGHGFCTPRPEGFPEGEARGKSRGSRGAKPMTKGNLEGGGDGFPNPSRVLVEHGHSLIITREGLILWNGLKILIPKHMRKCKIGLLEQIWAQNSYDIFFWVTLYFMVNYYWHFRATFSAWFQIYQYWEGSF